MMVPKKGLVLSYMIVATNLYNFLFMLPIMKERKSVFELRTNPVL